MHSDVQLEFIELLRGKTAMLGAMDLASDQVEMPEEVAEGLSRALNPVDTDKLVPINGAGLVSTALPSGR
ncbi:hypothetical protein [Curtobacterium flaccumfaciens]|uniref:hypothetical protein n=1 Tax=Curtobacterium flaccumfaciens TaxID=2035 RepID=UPI0037BF07E9